MVNVVVFYVTLVGTCAYALLRGGPPERIGAGIFIAATVLTGIAASSSRPGFQSMEAGILLVDAAMFVAFLVLALRAQRFWPLWMTGLQAVQVAGHAARLVDPEMIPWAYAIAQGFWSYPMMALLILGTWRHRQRLKRFGVDNSWVSSSTRSPQQNASPGPPV